jgi:hypothetical protein
LSWIDTLSEFTLRLLYALKTFGAGGGFELPKAYAIGSSGFLPFNDPLFLNG